MPIVSGAPERVNSTSKGALPQGLGRVGSGFGGRHVVGKETGDIEEPGDGVAETAIGNAAENAAKNPAGN